jgi:hypothetical protein
MRPNTRFRPLGKVSADLKNNIVRLIMAQTPPR